MVTKQSLATTGHNIANVNTEGFSRQNVEQTAGVAIPNGRLTFGTGAWAKKVTRVSDEYLERRIQGETKNFAHVEEKDNYLQQTEQIFNESNNDGLNRLATKLFNEFRQLSAEPANTAVRASVRESSIQLTADFRRMDNELREVAKNIDNRIEGYVRELNSLAKEVRDLNLAIEKAELDGGAAPDLHDKRDLALKRLGAMADISTSSDNNGRITITLAGHVPIVTGEVQQDLEVMRTPSDEKTGKKEDRLDIFVREPVPTKITTLLKTGRLGGLLEVRDKDIVAAQNKIDSVAYLIGKEINNIHRQGYGLDGGTNRDFFTEPTTKEGAASRMRLSKDVMDNLDAIAAAKDPNAPSDNRVAIALSGVSDLKGLEKTPTLLCSIFITEWWLSLV